MIYHIASRADWAAAQLAGVYAADSLASEGFIHCSTAEQVIATANRIFNGRPDLLLLSIERARIKHEIRFENFEGGTILYPHIYGALARDAVTAVHALPICDDGRFAWPAGAAQVPDWL
jgi:hypothetical protein